MIRYQMSKSTPEPDTTSKYAEVWRGQLNLEEGGNSSTDVCIKAIKTENVHKVGETSSTVGQPVEQHILGLPRGGYTMGEVEPSKHPPMLRCDGRSVPNRDGVDAKRASHEIRTRTSRR